MRLRRLASDVDLGVAADRGDGPPARLLGIVTGTAPPQVHGGSLSPDRDRRGAVVRRTGRAGRCRGHGVVRRRWRGRCVCSGKGVAKSSTRLTGCRAILRTVFRCQRRRANALKTGLGSGFRAWPDGSRHGMTRRRRLHRGVRPARSSGQVASAAGQGLSTAGEVWCPARTDGMRSFLATGAARPESVNRSLALVLNISQVIQPWVAPEYGKFYSQPDR